MCVKRTLDIDQLANLRLSSMFWLATIQLVLHCHCINLKSQFQTALTVFFSENMVRIPRAVLDIY